MTAWWLRLAAFPSCLSGGACGLKTLGQRRPCAPRPWHTFPNSWKKVCIIWRNRLRENRFELSGDDCAFSELSLTGKIRSLPFSSFLTRAQPQLSDFNSCQNWRCVGWETFMEVRGMGDLQSHQQRLETYRHFLFHSKDHFFASFTFNWVGWSMPSIAFYLLRFCNIFPRRLRTGTVCYLTVSLDLSLTNASSFYFGQCLQVQSSFLRSVIFSHNVIRNTQTTASQECNYLCLAFISKLSSQLLIVQKVYWWKFVSSDYADFLLVVWCNNPPRSTQKKGSRRPEPRCLAATFIQVRFGREARRQVG